MPPRRRAISALSTLFNSGRPPDRTSGIVRRTRPVGSLSLAEDDGRARELSCTTTITARQRAGGRCALPCSRRTPRQASPALPGANRWPSDMTTDHWSRGWTWRALSRRQSSTRSSGPITRASTTRTKGRATRPFAKRSSSRSTTPPHLVSALATVTEHLGFAFSANVIQEPPFSFARRVATLDHLTKGRVAWNIVTSFQRSAWRNVGHETVADHAERYARAAEYVDVVYKLLEGSWEDRALVRDEEHRRLRRPVGDPRHRARGGVLPVGRAGHH